MRALTASEIIHLWETAYCFHPIDQALSVLRMVMPDHSRNDLAALPLGQRDSLLLALRKITFGDTLAGQNDCPHCNETVEFELSCSTLGQDFVEPGQKTVSQDGYTFQIRPLNSFDLAAAADEATLQRARDLLLQRCSFNVHYQGKAIDLDKLPKEIEKTLSKTMLAADPQAEKLLNLTCPSCRHHWHSMLEIGHILWLEITARAQRLLMEVHLLARTYGWGETEILNLSPARRAAYLQMVAT